MSDTAAWVSAIADMVVACGVVGGGILFLRDGLKARKARAETLVAQLKAEELALQAEAEHEAIVEQLKQVSTPEEASILAKGVRDLPRDWLADLPSMEALRRSFAPIKGPKFEMPEMPKINFVVPRLQWRGDRFEVTYDPPKKDTPPES